MAPAEGVLSAPPDKTMRIFAAAACVGPVAVVVIFPFIGVVLKKVVPDVNVVIVPNLAAVVASPIVKVVLFIPANVVVILPTIPRIRLFAGKSIVESVVPPPVASAMFSLSVANSAVSPFAPVSV